MRQVIIGYGEIGQAVGNIIGDHWVVDSDFANDIDGDGTVEIMHVCFPYDDSFEDAVHAYIEEYKPQHIVVWSTVPIGTTERFGIFASHSPVEGKHPDLELSIRTMERWVGTFIQGEAQYLTNFFQGLGLRVKIVGSPRYTEALKLLSTTEYGVNIEFARYKAKVAEEIGMDYELTKEWNRSYNRLYKELGMEKRFQKFVLDEPLGKIGGHCVGPNARILNEDYPGPLVTIVEKAS